MCWLLSFFIVTIVGRLRILQDIHRLAIFKDVGEGVYVFDPGGDDNSVGTLSNGADNLVIIADLKVCSVDNDTTATLLKLGSLVWTFIRLVLLAAALSLVKLLPLHYTP